MGLKEDLDKEVKKIFISTWNKRKGKVVPDVDSISFSNEGVILDATILYADLDQSTRLVDSQSQDQAAEVYKTFLYSTAKLIRELGGEITAYDGDRIMAVFLGDYKNTQAAKTALKINYVVKKIIQTHFSSVYSFSTYTIRHVVGIDTSEILVAKTGIRGFNDLVWVGRAANYAAKLCSRSSDYATYITKNVYDRLADEAKFSGDNKLMWTPQVWSEMNNMGIYCSNWTWVID